MRFILKEKLFTAGAIACAVLLTAAALSIILHEKRFEPLLVLHFDRVSGIDLFGGVGDTWGIFGVGSGVVIMNFVLAYVSRSRDRFLANILVIASVLFAFFLLIALGTIVSVN